MGLTNKEIDDCRAAFARFDPEGTGVVHLAQLGALMRALGRAYSEEELFLMVSSVDENGTGGVDFPDLLRLVLRDKDLRKEKAGDLDTLEAFASMGGKLDTTGMIKTAKLMRAIEEFELTVDVDELLRKGKVEDKEGFMNYSEFKAMFET